MVGTAKILAELKQQWSGTLVIIGQPAEEVGEGARAMLSDDLYTKFPRPDFAVALHDNSDLRRHRGYTDARAGEFYHGVKIRGGGAPGQPEATKIRFVMAGIVLASRPSTAGNISVDLVWGTVGSIHSAAAQHHPR